MLVGSRSGHFDIAQVLGQREAGKCPCSYSMSRNGRTPLMTELMERGFIGMPVWVSRALEVRLEGVQMGLG
jgi:hypothetical protein